MGDSEADSTARPSNAFSTGSSGTHSHNLETKTGSDLDLGGGVRKQDWNTGDGYKTITGGAHGHTITSGGDAETRPRSKFVYYCIKL